LAILTISRQMGSLGDEVAEAVSRRLGWELITRDKLVSMFFCTVTKPQDRHMLAESAKFYLTQYQDNYTYLDFLKQSLNKYVRERSVVALGFGSQLIFANDRDAIHVRIIAPVGFRISRVRKQYHVSDEDAAKILGKADKKHKRFVAAIFGADLTDASLYNLTINTADLPVDECAAIILALVREREARRQSEAQAAQTDIVINPADRPSFKNPAEVEFARILDMYQIEWKYEPKTFPIEWDAEGNVTQAFSPDFYLPQFDTYIELTTMNQRYVTIKNRKAKKLRELYPGTNIKIVYKKDFQSLIERFKMTREG
jgi:cytidylate kinase